MKFWMAMTLALALGLCIGWMDSRPTWDDTGVTVIALVAGAGLLGVLSPKHAWLWGSVIGGCVVAWNLASGGNFAALIAVPFALAGAFVGMLVRKSFAGT